MKSYLRYSFAFLLPFTLLIGCLMALGFAPFGDLNFLVNDGYYQYFPLFTHFREIILNGDWSSFVYDWNLNWGESFIPTFAYYLASPLSLLILLFPADKVSEGMMWITVIKLSIAGLTFFWCIDRQKPISYGLSLLFSCSYALMGWGILYSSNLMWLDALIWLPLIIIGVQQLLVERKVLLLMWALIACIWSNFYISFMVGGFTFLIFHLFFFQHQVPSENIWRSRSLWLKNYLQKLSLFLGIVLLALTCSWWLWQPCLLILVDSLASIHEQSQLLLSTPIEWLMKTFVGYYDGVSNTATPSLYIGMLGLMGLISFFIHPTIPSRFKKRILFIFLIFITSFALSPFDNLWHGGRVPTWYPYRYSFTLGFLILYLGHTALNHPALYRHFAFGSVCAYLCGWFTLPLFFAQLMKTSFNTRFQLSFMLSIGSCILIGLAYRHFHENNARKWKLFLLLVVATELSLNMYLVFNALKMDYGYVSSTLLNETTEVSSEVAEWEQSEPYRFASSASSHANLSLLSQHRGLNFFNTLAPFETVDFLQSLFYRYPTVIENTNPHYYQANILLDSLFNVRYRISTTPLSSPYSLYKQVGNYYFYENPYALPIAYSISSSLLTEELAENNPFEKQLSLLQVLTQNDEKEDVIYTSINPVIYSSTNLRYEESCQCYVKLNSNHDASLVLQVTSEDSTPVHLLTQTFSLSDELLIDGMPIHTDVATAYAYAYNVITPQKSTFLYELNLPSDGSTSVQIPLVYQLNIENLIAQLKVIQSQGLQDVFIDGTTLEGSITLTEDSVVLFTMPYSPHWRATVNGETVTPIEISGRLLGLPLESGDYRIVLDYQATSTYFNLFISSSAFIIAIGLTLWGKLQKKD